MTKEIEAVQAAYNLTQDEALNLLRLKQAGSLSAPEKGKDSKPFHALVKKGVARVAERNFAKGCFGCWFVVFEATV